MTKIPEEYKHCNFCKHFFISPAGSPTVELFVCGRCGHCVNGVLMKSCWTPACPKFDFTIRPKYPIFSLKEANENQRNQYFKIYIRREMNLYG